MTTNQQTSLIKPSELIILGFKFKLDKGHEKIYAGHRLRVQLSHKHIRIRMLSCSCALVQSANYTKEDMQALLHGLQATPTDEA